MNFKRICRILICLVLVCALLVGVSPIKANAFFVPGWFACVNYEILCGVVAGIGFALGVGVAADIDNKFNTLVTACANELSMLEPQIYAAANSSYYAHRDTVEWVRSWLFDNGYVTSSTVSNTYGFSVSTISRTMNVGLTPYWGAEFTSLLKKAYYEDSDIVLYVYQDVCGGLYWEDGILCNGHWVNPTGETHAGVLGVYPSGELEKLSTCGEPCFSSSTPLFHNKTVAQNWESFTTSGCYAFDWSHVWKSGSGYTFFVKKSINTIWDNDQTTLNPGLSYPPGTTYIGGNYLYSASSSDVITWDGTTETTYEVMGSPATAYIGNPAISLDEAYATWVANSVTVPDSNGESDVFALPVTINPDYASGTSELTQEDAWAGAGSAAGLFEDTEAGTDTETGTGTGTTSGTELGLLGQILASLNAVKDYQVTGNIEMQDKVGTIVGTLGTTNEVLEEQKGLLSALITTGQVGADDIVAAVTSIPGLIGGELTDVEEELGVIGGLLTGTQTGVLTDMLTGIQSLPEAITDSVAEVFVPSEGYVEAKAEALVAQYPFANSLSVTATDFKNFVGNLGATPPIIYIDLGATEGSYNIGGKIPFIDLTWYKEYKPTMDSIIAAFLWLWLFWRLFLKLPGILSGMQGDAGHRDNYVGTGNTAQTGDSRPAPKFNPGGDHDYYAWKERRFNEQRGRKV